MFKSIEYLHYTYDKSTQKYIYHYHLVDSDFECDISASATKPAAVHATPTAAAVAAAVAAAASVVAEEYHKRGLDVVRNIYLLNVYVQKTWYDNWSFMNILNYQNKYVDEYCPIDGLNFSKDIYPGVKELYEKLNTFN